MKRFLILPAFFSVLAFSLLVSAQTNFKTYNNARFGYTISYPSDLLSPEAEADNGDGRRFTGDGATMLVFGTNLLLNKTLQKEFNAVIAERGGARNVSYKIYRPNYFVVSGKSDGKIFYQKTMKNSGGTFVTFMIEYDESKRALYDKAVAKIVKSFR